MIVTTFKSDEELVKYLHNVDNITIVACSICSFDCNCSDEKSIERIKQLIVNLNKTVLGVITIDAVCNSLKDLVSQRKHKELIDKTEYFLVLSCGSGVQTIKNTWKKKVIPALNTNFLASYEKGAIFEKKCIMCGDCVLFYTAGICPKTACSKGLKNGACGGCIDSKCEISSDIPCAWAIIYERLKEEKKLENLEIYFPPDDWSKNILKKENSKKS
jgi:ferredoxin